VAATIPSGTVTFVFTDIEGSTKLLQELGDGYAEVAREHRRLVRDAFTARGGVEVDTQGDAFFFSFPRARDAVAAAVDAQRALAEHEWPQGKEVRVRMGLHTGEPQVGDEGYLGLDVVRAARISAAGHGGQILISETTRALLGNNLPDGAVVHDLGETNLKDIQHEHVYQVSIDGGPTEFPPLKAQHPKTASESLAERIEAHVERELERAFTGEKTPKAATRAPVRMAAAGMTAAAITIFALVGIVLGVILLVKLVL
jgi:class 3 adenylate cyclase